MIPVWPMDLSSAGHYHFSRKSASSPENQGKEQHAPLAQLDRASVYGTEGCWFEPSGVYSKKGAGSVRGACPLFLLYYCLLSYFSSLSSF